MDADFTSNETNFRPICIKPKTVVDFTRQEGTYYAFQGNESTNASISIRKGVILSKMDCSDKPHNETEGLEVEKKDTAFLCFRWNAEFDADQPVNPNT